MWDVAVFVLNVLAFIITGLQLRPILAALQDVAWRDYAGFAGAVLLAVILIRIAWIACYNIVARWRDRRFGVRTRGIMTPPTIGTGTVIAWCGMRGIVTLATALALPEDDGGGFPFRGLILFCAFTTVLGTLVVQGLTLRPLMLALRLVDDGAIAREIRLARARTAEAALAALADYDGPFAGALRAEYQARLRPRDEAGAGLPDVPPPDVSPTDMLPVDARRRAQAAERRALLELRRHDEIGDDAFHAIEEELDWGEMYVEGRLGRS